MIKRVGAAIVDIPPGGIELSKARFAICKTCEHTLQDGYGCTHWRGCCFGRHRFNPEAKCPKNLWPM